MRDIRFRIFDKSENEIKDIDLFWFEENCINNIYDAEPDFIVMQYTGLKDKNIEVYHKDIGTDKFGKRVIVEWNEEHLCFGLLTIDEAVKDEWNFCLRDLKEIIGNIYENPELLEDKQ